MPIVFPLFMVLAVSGPVRRLKPSRRIIFLENVPGVTVGGGGVSLIIVSSSNRESSSILWISKCKS